MILKNTEVCPFPFSCGNYFYGYYSWASFLTEVAYWTLLAYYSVVYNAFSFFLFFFLNTFLKFMKVSCWTFLTFFWPYLCKKQLSCLAIISLRVYHLLMLHNQISNICFAIMLYMKSSKNKFAGKLY